ncbi:MAG: carboxypeptidase regulatory-like domain-containing protein [Candidatus Micrarchaeia archaeon]|jgi:uncharacterized membrane protein
MRLGNALLFALVLLAGFFASSANAGISAQVAVSVWGSAYYGYPAYSVFGCNPFAATYYVSPGSWLYVEPQVYPGFSFVCGNGYTGFYDCYYAYPGTYYLQWNYYGVPCGGVYVNVAQYPSNPSTVVIYNTAPQPTPEPVYCADGTPAGYCSSEEPKYCTPWGNLVEKASLCGCPAGKEADGNHCVDKKCSDGTPYGKCNANHEYCDNGFLRERADVCGCPEGERASGQYCEPTNSYCTVSLSPSTQRAGQPVSVSVHYVDFASAPYTAVVDCGNGEIKSAYCQGSSRDGYCYSSCTYSEDSALNSFLVKASFAGASCSAQASIAPAKASTASILAKVTDCGSGAPIQSASVSIQENGEKRSTDKNGEALFNDLSAGSYTLSVLADGFGEQVVSANAVTGRIVAVEACLNKEVYDCDVQAELVSQADCNAGPTQSFQVMVSNKLQEANNVSATYSASVPLSGPAFIPLAAGEARIVTVSASLPQGYSGAANAIASFKGKKQCSANVALPLCLSGGISLSASDFSKEALAGDEVCFDLMLRNRADKEAIVQMQANGDWDSKFDVSRAYLAAHETRAVKFCTFVPSGASGQHDFYVSAQSDLNDAQAVLSVIVPSSLVSSNFGSKCKALNVSKSRVYVPISLKNNGLDGDYFVEVEGVDGVSVSVSQPNIFGFQNGTNRTIYVSLIPEDLPASSDAHALLLVKRGDSVVLQQEICFRKSGGDYSSFAELAQPHITVVKGERASAFLRVRNTGTMADKYFVFLTPPFDGVAVSPQEQEVQPKKEALFEVSVSPSALTQAGEYAIPIQVFSQYADPLNDKLVKEEVLRVTVLEPPKSSALNATISASEVWFEKINDSLAAKFSVTISNYESDSLSYSLEVNGLPEGWNYSFEPAQVLLPFGQSKTFNVTVITKGMQEQDYNATVDLKASDGRLASLPVKISGSEAKKAGLLTGLFVLGGSDDIILAFLVILAVAGAYTYYKIQRLKQETADKNDAPAVS